MKGAHFYQTISSIVAGIAITAVSFYVFTPKAEDPLSGLKIEYRKMPVSHLMFTETVKLATADQAVDKTKVMEGYSGVFGFGGKFKLLRYTIKNSTERAINQLTAHLGDHIFGYVTDDSGSRAISEAEKTVSIRSLPSTISELVLVVNFAHWEPEERFLVDSRAIPITEIEPAFSNDPPFSE
ncbi:hypothetical protein [Sinorhizobium meliloti]